MSRPPTPPSGPVPVPYPNFSFAWSNIAGLGQTLLPEDECYWVLSEGPASAHLAESVDIGSVEQPPALVLDYLFVVP